MVFKFMKIDITFLVTGLLLLFCIYCKQSQELTKQSNIFVGDGNYSKILGKEFNKDGRNLVAILFTNKNCQSCESFQPQLKNIQNQFYSQGIPIFRCEISQSVKLNQKFKIKRFPIIHFVIKRKYDSNDKQKISIYKTNQIVSIKILQLARYLKRVVKYQNDFITIMEATYKANQQQLKQSLVNTLQQVPNMSRIIINLEQLQSNYGLNQIDLIKDILLEQNFNTMPVVPLSKELFAFYKIDNQIGKLSPQSNSQSSWIILSTKTKPSQKNQFIHLQIQYSDIVKLKNQNFQFPQILKFFLLYSVQEFTQSIFQIQTKTHTVLDINKPTYLAVLDSIWQRQKSHQFIGMLNTLMAEFDFDVNIFWTEGEINQQKKVLLGFNKSAQSPLFGKLILAGDMKKPLLNSLDGLPLFTQQQIRKFIADDLGYRVNLTKKIQEALDQMGLDSQIQTTENLKFQEQSSEIRLTFCTYSDLSHSQIQALYFIYERFSKFYPTSKLIILVSPCLIQQKSRDEGLYIIFQSSLTHVSKEIQECINIQPIIKKLTDSVALKLNRSSLLPEHFCVQEEQMREYLMSLQ